MEQARRQFLESNSSAEEFKQQATAYCEVLKHWGYDIRPYRSEELRHFHKAHWKVRGQALEYLDLNLAILRDIMDSEEPRSQGRQLLWRALSRMKVSPVSDILEKIDDEDVIEVYSHEQVQVFRNPMFFTYSSHSIEELLCLPWYRLYRRHWLKTLQVMRTAWRMVSGRIRQTEAWNIKPHLVEEIDSEKKYRMEIQFKYLSPLFKDGEFFGAICTSRAWFASASAPAESAEKGKRNGR